MIDDRRFFAYLAGIGTSGFVYEAFNDPRPERLLKIGLFTVAFLGLSYGREIANLVQGYHTIDIELDVPKPPKEDITDKL